jgi:hypothetical protein
MTFPGDTGNRAVRSGARHVKQDKDYTVIQVSERVPGEQVPLGL